MVVSLVLCLKVIQVRSAQRCTMSSWTMAYGPWQTGAPASWQSGGPWKTLKTDYSAGASHSWEQNSSWHDTAPWWSVENADKQSHVSSTCSRDEWQDCRPSTAHFVPNPKAVKVEKTSPAPVSAQALANFSYKDFEVIIIEKSLEDVKVEPWEVTSQQWWEATPSNWSRAKSTSSAASRSSYF